MHSDEEQRGVPALFTTWIWVALVSKLRARLGENAEEGRGGRKEGRVCRKSTASFGCVIMGTGSAQGEAAGRQGRIRERRGREWGGGVTAAAEVCSWRGRTAAAGNGTQELPQRARASEKSCDPLSQHPRPRLLQRLPRPSPHLSRPTLTNVKQQQLAPTRIVSPRLCSGRTSLSPLQPVRR